MKIEATYTIVDSKDNKIVLTQEEFNQLKEYINQYNQNW